MRWRRLLPLALLVALALLPLVGHWARRVPAGRCALDGAPIPALYRVRIRDDGGQDQVFCCIHCAEVWLERQARRPVAIFVTDEVTGAEIDASAAYFVRSSVVTTPTTGNRIHAFASRAAARYHAESAYGRLLTGPDRPLQ
jgi:hypothetical protein